MITNKRDSERGQAIILLVLALVGIMAFLALLMDGGRIFAERVQAQNAADNAAIASALEMCRDEEDLDLIKAPGITYASEHGYVHDGTYKWVTINIPPASGPYTATNYIEVLIRSRIPTSFVHLVYQGPLEVTARAVAECKGGGATARASPQSLLLYMEAILIVIKNPSNFRVIIIIFMDPCTAMGIGN